MDIQITIGSPYVRFRGGKRAQLQGVPNRKAIRVIATMRNGNNYQVLVAKRQDSDEAKCDTRRREFFAAVRRCSGGMVIGGAGAALHPAPA